MPPGFRGSMKFHKLKALGLGIGLFVVVYVPAFTTVALVRPRIEIAIPLIIAITLLVALLLIFLLARSPAGIAEFGFHIPQSRYVVGATLSGLTIGFAVTFLSHSFRVGRNRSTQRDRTWAHCGRIEATQRQPSAGENRPRSVQRR